MCAAVVRTANVKANESLEIKLKYANKPSIIADNQKII